MCKLLSGFVLGAALLFIGGDGLAFERPMETPQVTTEQVAELVLVYVYNESSYRVDFYVDGDYKTEIDPNGWATIGVSVGYHTFFADKEYDGIDTSVRFYVPSGGCNYTIP